MTLFLTFLSFLLLFFFFTTTTQHKQFVDAQWRFCSQENFFEQFFYCESRGFCLPATNEGFCACAASRDECSTQLDPRGIPCRWNSSYNVPNRPLKNVGYDQCITSSSSNFNCETPYQIIVRCVPGLNESQKQWNEINGIPDDEDISNDRKDHPCQSYDVHLPTLTPQPYLFLFLGIFKDLLVLIFVGLIGNWLNKLSFKVTQTLSDLWNFSWDSRKNGGDDEDDDDKHKENNNNNEITQALTEQKTKVSKDADDEELVFYIHDVPFSTKPIRNPNAKNRRIWSFDDYCSAVAKQLFERRSSREAQRKLCDAIAFVLVNNFLYIKLTSDRPLSGKLKIPAYTPWNNLVLVVAEVLRKSSNRRVRYGLSKSALVRIDVALNQFPTPPQLFLYVASAVFIVVATLGTAAIQQFNVACPQNICTTPRAMFKNFYFLVGYRICNSSLIGTAVLVILKTLRTIFFTNQNDMVANRLSLLILQSSRPVFLLLVLYVLITGPFLFGGMFGGFFEGWPGPVLILGTLPILLILYCIRRCFLNYTAAIEMKNLQQFQNRREYSQIHSDFISQNSRTTFVISESNLEKNNNAEHKNSSGGGSINDEKEKEKLMMKMKNNSKNNLHMLNSGVENAEELKTNKDHGEDDEFSSSSESGDDEDDYNEQQEKEENVRRSSWANLGKKDDDEEEDDDDDLAAFAKDRPETKSALDFAKKQKLQQEKEQKEKKEQQQQQQLSKKTISSTSRDDLSSAKASYETFGGEASSSTHMISALQVRERQAMLRAMRQHHSDEETNQKSCFCSGWFTFSNFRFFLRALTRFLLTEEILVILFSFVLQASFSYTALLAKRAEFGIEHQSEVFALDYNARKIECVVSILESKISAYDGDLLGKLQHSSFCIPFL